MIIAIIMAFIVVMIIISTIHKYQEWKQKYLCVFEENEYSCFIVDYNLEDLVQ